MALNFTRNIGNLREESGLIIYNNIVTDCKMLPGITYVEIPEGITVIYWGAFAGQYHLKKY